MRFKHYHEFEGMEELELMIDYDHQPFEAQILYPTDDAYEGCSEAALINYVAITINGKFTGITSLLTEDFKEKLEELCLEDYGNQRNES